MQSSNDLKVSKPWYCELQMNSSFESDRSIPTGNVCFITKALISAISRENEANFDKIQTLDLPIRDSAQGKIRRIENLNFTPNLRYLNLSYNAITKIEGLRHVGQLIELNLAENAIEQVRALYNNRAVLH